MLYLNFHKVGVVVSGGFRRFGKPGIVFGHFRLYIYVFYAVHEKVSSVSIHSYKLLISIMTTVFNSQFSLNIYFLLMYSFVRGVLLLEPIQHLFRVT